jgi:hypothetical protein
MREFQRLGFIDYANGLKVNRSLLSVVVDDMPRRSAPDERK